MNLVKCASGHFFDSERFSECPHCKQAAPNANNLTMPVMRAPENDAVTVALVNAPTPENTPAEPAYTGQPMKTESLQDAVKAATMGNMNEPVRREEQTVGFFSSTLGKEPVVGWLVCTQGEHFGEDFRLKSGRNFIGRSQAMDVAITKDSTVSRDRHAVIVYEPRGNIFIVQPGDSRELSYLNDSVVLSPCEVKVHDRLTIGKTELMFIPCCTANFHWDANKNAE